MPTLAPAPARPGLRFLHIPKTAGTTMVHILRAQYRFSGRFEFSGDPEVDACRLAALPERARVRIRLFAGHAPLRTGVETADRCPLITMLREPIARVQSFCRHVSEGKSPYLLERFPPARFDLDEFLWSGNAELSNLQTRMLLNTRSCDAPWPAALSDQRAAELALENLQCVVRQFGVQEYFDESVQRFSATFGWRHVRYRPRNRARGGRRLVFAPHHLRRIAELNAVDSEVYRLASARFVSSRGLQPTVRPGARSGALLDRGWTRAASVLGHLFG
jgi:hypothetical protein